MSQKDKRIPINKHIFKIDGRPGVENSGLLTSCNAESYDDALKWTKRMYPRAKTIEYVGEKFSHYAGESSRSSVMVDAVKPARKAGNLPHSVKEVLSKPGSVEENMADAIGAVFGGA